MEKFSDFERNPRSSDHESSAEIISERITEHSRIFDEETVTRPSFSKEESQEARNLFEMRRWQIKDADVRAIGVSHIPETFLFFRKEIEEAIKDSDLVITEFAPEAMGLYDTTQKKRLSGIRSKANDDYNLEELREMYLKTERGSGAGTFHHEIELLAAKYGKDILCTDFYFARDAESFLQISTGSLYQLEEANEAKAAIKQLERLGLGGSAAVAELAAFSSFVENFRRPISRRRFLKAGIFAAAGFALGGASATMHPPKENALKEWFRTDKEDQIIQRLRDPVIANTLEMLGDSKYKKIAFIYGVRHLDWIQEYLDNPEKIKRELIENKEELEHFNPDPVHLYQLTPGENHSERFVASENLVWQQIPLEVKGSDTK